MGASLYYRPLEDKTYADAGSSRLVDALTKVYGEPPWRLDESEIKTLEGMEAAGVDIGSLVDAIRKHGGIEVWAEY